MIMNTLKNLLDLVGLSKSDVFFIHSIIPLPFFLFFPSSFNQRLCESRKKVYGIAAYYTMYDQDCESSNIFCLLFVIGAKL